MPALIVLDLILQIGCAIHIVRTGRPTMWFWAVITLPFIGSIAYILVELAPEWLGTAHGQRTVRSLHRKLDPERDYRRLAEQVSISPTPHNLIRLADECVAMKRFDEAVALYRRAAGDTGIEDPAIAVKLAAALVEKGEAAAAKTVLDGLRRANPDYQSADAHLVYARALEGIGDHDEASREYEAVIAYFPGAEARCRYGAMLHRRGDTVRARLHFEEVVRRLERSPRHARDMQHVWFSFARDYLRENR
jgi:hypothetical protein